MNTNRVLEYSDMNSILLEYSDMNSLAPSVMADQADQTMVMGEFAAFSIMIMMAVFWISSTHMSTISSAWPVVVLITKRSLLASNMLYGSASPTSLPLDIVSFFASSNKSCLFFAIITNILVLHSMHNCFLSCLSLYLV